MEYKVPPPWESRVRRLLRGELSVEDAVKLPPADRTEGYDPDVFRADMVLLSNLNDIYKATKSWKLIEFGINILGGKNRILYLGEDIDWAEYAALCETEGRLLSVGEFYSLLEGSTFELEEELGPIEITEEPIEDPYALMSIEEAEKTIPSKSVVLGSYSGYSYIDVCAAMGSALSPKDYAEFVASRTDLEVRRECSLQLSAQLRTIDEILMSMELKRTPENREKLVHEIFEKSPGFMFVKENRLYPKRYILAHPEKFPISVMANPLTKVKCNGDCLACPNFQYTLAIPYPKLEKI